jgi:hypothetical protein
VAGAVAAGYALGRFKKLRLAILVATAMSSPKFRTAAVGLIQDRVPGGAVVGGLTKEVGGRLFDAGKTAATSVVASRIGSLSENLAERSQTMRKSTDGHVSKSQAEPEPDDEETDEAEEPRDEYEEEEDSDVTEEPTDEAYDEEETDEAEEPQDEYEEEEDSDVTEEPTDEYEEQEGEEAEEPTDEYEEQEGEETEEPTDEYEEPDASRDEEPEEPVTRSPRRRRSASPAGRRRG